MQVRYYEVQFLVKKEGIQAKCLLGKRIAILFSNNILEMKLQS